MGQYTELGKNLMLDALKGTNPTTPITHAALFDRATPHNVTGVTSTDTITDNGNGYSNGDLIIFTAKTGGSNIVLGRPYFVTGVTTNTYTLSATPGGSTVDLGSDLTATTTVVKLVELTGGSPAYARKAISFNAASGGSIDDSTAPTFDVPAGATVDDMGLYSASTAGTLLAIDDLTSEAFAGQGTYQLTDVDCDLNT